MNRRKFLRTCGAAGLASSPVLESWSALLQAPMRHRGAADRILSLNGGWLFGRKQQTAAAGRSFGDAALPRVTLPHTVAPLSWQHWDPVSWQDVWIFHRRFSVPPEMRGLRLFLHFDRALAIATPMVNGHALPQHSGGFLPFEHEVTELTQEDDNLLAVEVDARWLPVPPAGSPKGPPSVDYFLPGGITGSVCLRAVPAIFIRDVFARPVNVLDSNRRVEITCQIDAAGSLPAAVHLVARLEHGGQTVAHVSQEVAVEQPIQETALVFNRLGNIALWDSDNPHLYDLVVTLMQRDKPIHTYRTRIGFREARFDVDGFFLNGRRTRIFGLDRHELYPYVGFSAPARLLRRDAELLRRDFNCNAVRCSHYPQSEAFLDRCDELGLMVWEETPGWQYLGDQAWQELVVQDVGAMVRRDRNHPAIVIWGVRVNESRNDPQLYRRTREIAKALDGSRPTSGTMTPDSRKGWEQEWHQDVFAFDDYHSSADGSVGIDPPLPGVPYLITETVGQFNYGGKGFSRTYRRAGDPGTQMEQALCHAEAHSKAAGFARCSGVIAWCALDYPSPVNSHDGIKCPGIADVFRIPKLGASFYLAQVEPTLRVVIEPNFFWCFGSQTPRGPGKQVAIFSNCDRLELFVGDRKHAVLHPDRRNFPGIAYPPFFADLEIEGSGGPQLRIDGYLGSKLVHTRRFSADRSTDKLLARADDPRLEPDGSDATRLLFGVVDEFDVPRAFAGGAVHLTIEGPGVLVGDNPFDLEPSGGMGAVWIRTIPNQTGMIQIDVAHTTLGRRTVEIEVRKARAEAGIGGIRGFD